MKRFLILLICLLIATNIITAFGDVRRNRPSSYKWLNPQLSFTEKPILNKSAYLNFMTNLENTIAKMKKEGRINNAAIFFRDLINGPTFSINPNENFIPSSLLKLPLAITYLNLADEDKISLNEKLSAPNFTINLIPIFPPLETIKENTPYSIQELLRRLIIYSDNRAWEILFNYLYQIEPDADLLGETYKNLGIIDVAMKDVGGESLSVKSYASLFRLLYNASYLSPESSEMLLNYLTKATFNDGLKRGVPNNISVAHKFGERFIDDKKQLHDCGIIYYPNNPYLLCVMTRGRDFKELTDIITAISKSVYEEVDSRRLD